MDKRKDIEKKLEDFKRKVNKDFPIDKMYLFGSRVFGKIHKDSDVDLIIVSPKFRELDFFQRGAKMYNYWKIYSPVDFLCYTPEEFKKFKKQTTIVAQAIKEGREIL